MPLRLQGAVPSNSTLMNWMPPCKYRARACSDTLAVEAEAAAAGSAMSVNTGCCKTLHTGLQMHACAVCSLMKAA